MANLWEVLQQLGAFEWAAMRPGMGETGDSLNFPPIFCWRYQNHSEEQEEIIRQAMTSFVGKVRWEFIQPENSRNWVIRPTRLSETFKEKQLPGLLDAAEFLARECPEFGQLANQEMSRMAEHFQTVFQNQFGRFVTK